MAPWSRSRLKKNQEQEPEPLREKNQEPEPLKNLPAPKPWKLENNKFKKNNYSNPQNPLFEVDFCTCTIRTLRREFTFFDKYMFFSTPT